MHPRRKAFSLIELIVVLAIIATILSVLLPALAKARRSARVTVCHSNMRQYATALSNYAVDFKSAICAFSWKPNSANSRFADLNSAATSQHAHADQGVDIVRRFTGRLTDGYYSRITDRMLDRNFGHLPLIDAGYMGQRIPEPAAACPEDRSTLVWQRGVKDYASALRQTGDPDPGSSVAFKKMLPFWTTYQFIPNVWSPETGPGVIHQASGGAGEHLLYVVSQNTRFVQRTIDEVLFPSQKVWQFDTFDRHFFRRTLWHAYPEARQPLMFFDGSVSVRRAADSNPGWNPTMAQAAAPTTYQYWPTPNEPPTLSGRWSDSVIGRFRWTRAGLKGVDYGGKEQKRY